MSKPMIYFHPRYGDYIAILNECLTCFQYLEEALKDVLRTAEKIVSYRVKGYLPYDPTPGIESVQNCALGRLIDKYSRYCDDKPLIAELKEFKKQRDELAHRGFLISTDETYDETYMKETIRELDKIREDTSSVINKLLQTSGDFATKLKEAKGEAINER